MRSGARALAGVGLVGAGLLAAAPALAQTQDSACADLAGMKLAGLTVTTAEVTTSLAAVSPQLAKESAQPFCRVGGTLRPTADSEIRFELWMPVGSKWNGKFQAVGNGGFFGVLNYRSALGGVKRGYAVMTSDLGHTNAPGASEDATWALGHGAKVVDYAYRGEHSSVVASKALLAKFYGKAADHAYYTGCSAGGIQGLTELLRYPEDFDGYVIGAATPDHVGQELGAMWNTLQASLLFPADALKAPQVTAIHEEVLRQCVGKDGGLPTDRFLTDPRLCRFRVEALACKPGAASETCLNPRQVAIVRAIYAGPRNPRTGAELFSGIMPGSELTWGAYFTGKTNPAKPDRPWGGFMMYMAYGDADYLPGQKYLKFDWDKDVTALRAMQVGGETLDSSWNTRNRDLDKFVAAGGKVIQYHGWDDPNIPPMEAVKFRQSLVDSLVKRRKMSVASATNLVDSYHRLFMIPGMGHCSGGPGPWSIAPAPGQPADGEHDMLTALENWVEKGADPKRLIGAHLSGGAPSAGNPNGGAGAPQKPDMTRPICAFPAAARYTGKGDSADAANYTCVRPAAAKRK
ncbi:tannase/feruloyl esterase family alpha/beta hydrolase [Novosphingobium flavum]|uniref:Tannase/feruloyl esterase family alpha/beta hydrolase n=1 Tax=Novosphingobium flavum TaxID=1778672 RepID=A0A7X1KLP2_9SPHN|nr:tannase/feruloyl esterase family alpha/beta hydrolase [Novosphingobium flavum]MBC2665518.1 tannase/feruloyl esterase family alpha/beta hydrolase [Novosphingobium flavum]